MVIFGGVVKRNPIGLSIKCPGASLDIPPIPPLSPSPTAHLSYEKYYLYGFFFFLQSELL